MRNNYEYRNAISLLILLILPMFAFAAAGQALLVFRTWHENPIGDYVFVKFNRSNRKLVLAEGFFCLGMLFVSVAFRIPFLNSSDAPDCKDCGSASEAMK
jgi:hypothetical protein